MNMNFAAALLVTGLVSAANAEIHTSSSFTITIGNPAPREREVVYVQEEAPPPRVVYLEPEHHCHPRVVYVEPMHERGWHRDSRYEYTDVGRRHEDFRREDRHFDAPMQRVAPRNSNQMETRRDGGKGDRVAMEDGKGSRH